MKPGTVAFIPVGKYCFSEKDCNVNSYLFTVEKSGLKCLFLEYTKNYYKVLINGNICYMTNYLDYDEFEVINDE